MLLADGPAMTLRIACSPLASFARRALSLAVVAAAVLVASPAEAKGNLWLVMHSGVVGLGCQSMLEDFYACLLNASNFNDTVSSYSNAINQLRPSQPLDFAGSYVIDTDCGTPDSPGWEPMLQCVVDAAKLPIQAGDYVMYFPPPGGFDARNCTVCNETPSGGGSKVSIRGGYVQSGKCDGLTFGGIHETFEAITEGISDDCCNGGCSSSGTGHYASSCYSLPACGELSVKCGYRSDQLQRITKGPHTNGLFYGEDCFPISVTAAPDSPESVCTLAHDERIKGRCIGDAWITCEYKPVTQACDDGCVADPDPRCAKVDATCTIDAPKKLCAGQRGDVTITCKNAGDLPWSSDVVLKIAPDGSKSPLVDPTWPLSTVPARLASAPVMPGDSGTFSFSVRAPDVDGGTTVAQKLALGIEGGRTYAHPSDLSLSIAVSPCGATSGGGGAASDAGGDAADLDATADDQAGCSCEQPGGASPAAPWGGAIFVGVAIVARRSRGAARLARVKGSRRSRGA
jgi:hypothetical protein